MPDDPTEPTEAQTLTAEGGLSAPADAALYTIMTDPVADLLRSAAAVIALEDDGIPGDIPAFIARLRRAADLWDEADDDLFPSVQVRRGGVDFSTALVDAIDNCANALAVSRYPRPPYHQRVIRRIQDNLGDRIRALADRIDGGTD